MGEIVAGKMNKRMLMKRYIVLLSVLAVLGVTANAQQAKTAAPKTEPVKAQPAKPESSKTEASAQAVATQVAKKRQSLVQNEKPNEIIGEKVSYSGIAVQLAKGDNPLQLVNPAAPARYGTPEDNTLRNPIDNKVIGLKIFSIKF